MNHGCTATATACLFILTKQKQCNIASCELSKRLPAKQSQETDKGIVSRTAILDTPVLASTHTFIKCSEKLFWGAFLPLHYQNHIPSNNAALNGKHWNGHRYPEFKVIIFIKWGHPSNIYYSKVNEVFKRVIKWSIANLNTQSLKPVLLWGRKRLERRTDKNVILDGQGWKKPSESSLALQIIDWIILTTICTFLCETFGKCLFLPFNRFSPLFIGLLYKKTAWNFQLRCGVQDKVQLK